jgi:hypothetical protein
MYTLRVLHPSGDEQNYYLGDLYKVTLKNKSPKNFILTYSSYLEEHIDLQVDDEDGLYGFITSYNQGVQPLYSISKHYIVMESGKTFQKL